MSRRRILAAVVATVVLAAGGGWFAGTTIRSPAQIAADRRPPDASLVTASAERRVLSSTVIGRGTVRYGEPKEVTLPTSPSAEGAATVTRPATEDTVLTEGAVALEVAGRPTAVLQGDVPMYRDLGPGDTGADVRQLEAALDRLGFRPGEVDGTYDAATEGAVDAWYRAMGSEARGPSEEDRAALRSARDAVVAAEDRLLQARTALATAEEGASAADRTEAHARVRAAERAVDEAEADASLAAERIEVAEVNERAALADEDIARSKVELARSNVAVARATERTTESREELAERALDSAIAARQRDDARADAEVQAREHAVRAAEDRRHLAQLTREALERRRDDSDPDNDPAEGELEQARADERAAAGALDDARADRSVAELSRAATRIAGLEAVAAAEVAAHEARGATLAARAARQAAEVGVAEAEAAVVRAIAARMTAAVGAKEAALTSIKSVGTLDAARDDRLVATARQQQLDDPKDLGVLQEAVDNAGRALEDARAALAELDGETGIIVPANEVLFFVTLPLRVDAALADAGGDATGPVMTVTTSRLATDVALPVADARLVDVGDRVTITSSELGVEVEGVVTEKGAEPGTDGVEANQVYVEVTPEDAPPELTGASVRVAIAVESTDGEVLAVPVAAVSVAPDGTSRVQVEDEPGRTRWVEVEPGLAADGFVEVTVPDGALDEGDRVVVNDADE